MCLEDVNWSALLVRSVNSSEVVWTVFSVAFAVPGLAGLFPAPFWGLAG